MQLRTIFAPPVRNSCPADRKKTAHLQQSAVASSLAPNDPSQKSGDASESTTHNKQQPDKGPALVDTCQQTQRKQKLRHSANGEAYNDCTTVCAEVKLEADSKSMLKGKRVRVRADGLGPGQGLYKDALARMKAKAERYASPSQSKPSLTRRRTPSASGSW